MNAAAPALCLKALEHATKGVDQRLKKILKARTHGPAAEMYSMLAYFLGFLDEHLKPASGSGKRLRPGLCLLIAEGYGARTKAFNAALAIELFHNFTLIHDDVEDRDEVRRNRPTVWKLWGINHAINSGDAQSLLVSELALQAGEKIAPVLMKAFIEVIEEIGRAHV